MCGSDNRCVVVMTGVVVVMTDVFFILTGEADNGGSCDEEVCSRGEQQHYLSVW